MGHHMSHDRDAKPVLECHVLKDTKHPSAPEKTGTVYQAPHRPEKDFNYTLHK